MKTSLEINPEKLQQAMKLIGARSIRDAVDQALDALISKAKRYEMAKLLGSGFFEGKRSPGRVKKHGRSRR